MSDTYHRSHLLPTAITTARTTASRRKASSSFKVSVVGSSTKSFLLICFLLLLTNRNDDPTFLCAANHVESQAAAAEAAAALEHYGINGTDGIGICPPCPQCIPDDLPDETITCQILVVDSPGIITMVKWNADDYYIHTGGKVKIEIKLAPTMPALFEEIENDARHGGGLFDAYYTNPVILGTAAVLNGFLDLTPYVKENSLSDWTDVLLALRNYVTSFEDKIYIILLDGDTHTLFYRKDVLEHFNLTVPRTWNEYTEVAKAVHGQVFEGIELSGSCVSRIQGDHAMYWSHLVLSTITQTEGTSTGSLFDPKDMSPLTGEAMAEMLRIQEAHNKYGSPDELSDIINHVQNENMNAGSCAMTFMWGDMFRRSNSQGSILHARLGIAPTPGSEVVLNRATGKLERCTLELCPYAKYYDDIGFVNSAPYAANGGWGAAVSANAPPEKQKALADFFIWASSRDQAQQYVIPNSTLPWYEINGQDPFRKSQLDVDLWEAQGYDRELSKQYVESILTNLVSKNVVVEIRFPKAGEIMSVLDKEVNEYLVRVNDGLIDEEKKHQERLRVSQSITDQWNRIIKEYNQRGDTVVPILEIYQRLRGVFVPNEQKNYLDKLRPVGLTLMAIIVASAFCGIFWVGYKRDAPVVKSSQPPFLLLICAGIIIMASSIIPMGIDDSVATFRGCDMACMATPWLISIGFSVCFAALFSKIWRLRTLMRHAANFRRIEVHVQDVLAPFCVILVLNVAFLLTWTIADPLRWVRVDLGRNEEGIKESFGRCTSSGRVSTAMASLLGVVNIFALVLANIQSYQTRELSVAFNESKFVGLSMASILQAMLIGLPLLFLADTNTNSRYLVRCILVFVVCMSVLLFIFLPKMMRGDKQDFEPGRVSRVSNQWRLSQFNNEISRDGRSSILRNSGENDPTASRISGVDLSEAAAIAAAASAHLGPSIVSDLNQEDDEPSTLALETAPPMKDGKDSSPKSPTASSTSEEGADDEESGGSRRRIGEPITMKHSNHTCSSHMEDSVRSTRSGLRVSMAGIENISESTQ